MTGVCTENVYSLNHTTCVSVHFLSRGAPWDASSSLNFPKKKAYMYVYYKTQYTHCILQCTLKVYYCSPFSINVLYKKASYKLYAVLQQGTAFIVHCICTNCRSERTTNNSFHWADFPIPRKKYFAQESDLIFPSFPSSSNTKPHAHQEDNLFSVVMMLYIKTFDII